MSRSSSKRRHALRKRYTIPAAAAGLAAAAAFVLVPGSAEAAYPGPGVVTGDVGAHDPSMVKTPAGKYLLYSTHGLVEGRSSTDRTAFKRTADAFAAPPSWWAKYSPDNDPWAPDISRVGDTYYMYYSLSTFGTNNSAIGLATSATGEPGSWKDHGLVVSSRTSDDFNAIDPSLLVDGGKWYLAFGSFWSGIKQIELDPATGKPKAGATRYSLASRQSADGAVEGPTVVKRGSYFYLFASYDKCCSGTDSTYKIKVGRATSPNGPYVDRNGVDMRKDGGTPVLESHGDIVGPGGQDVLLDDADGDLLVYHYYDAKDNGSPKLGLNLIDWSGGWPRAR
ncbi:arabinan endo-1,5-alpha-L-arabinosidase [Streptomyces sp. A7024]|uniref:Arabinan endo-1,5-alpha-L-arabinosidase n=1 Tax=Streptomyces coryli TaxID=1128680 RepID=A0A6G4U6G6_9ACTN|nr:arabinan endo-1,5-alpha-L-arabinosidase [Streptomyces coryli]NGN67835.1 arabinan endo-1,5-alpha-L-arabinosidase [Streptomyces coryli]